MNKKIKIIDLFLKIANGEKIPERILFKGIEFIWKNNHYMSKDNKINLTIDIMNNINSEVEILEDNTEEIEEYKGENFEQLGYEVGKLYLDFAKGIAKAVNELKKVKE